LIRNRSNLKLTFQSIQIFVANFIFEPKFIETITQLQIESPGTLIKIFLLVTQKEFFTKFEHLTNQNVNWLESKI